VKSWVATFVSSSTPTCNAVKDLFRFQIGIYMV
jgi:hypothetical protein